MKLLQLMLLNAYKITLLSLQPLLCSKLAESNSDFWSVLPLIQALLPGVGSRVSGMLNTFYYS